MVTGISKIIAVIILKLKEYGSTGGGHGSQVQ